MSSHRTAPRPCRICRAGALPALLAVAAGLAAVPAAAQSSPYYAAGSLALTHDANLLRLAGDQTPGDGESRSEQAWKCERFVDATAV